MSEAYSDQNHQGNGKEYHTGKLCVEEGCDNPAGTAWSPYFCFACNVKRINRINRQFDALIGKYK